MNIYFMSPPTAAWQVVGRANFRSEDAVKAQAKHAIREWISLADQIESLGGRVICLVPDSETHLTGLPYAAESGQVVEYQGELVFLLPQMLSPHRQTERRLWKSLAQKLSLQVVKTQKEGDCWEAQGDVAFFQNRTLLFYGGRTNRSGLEKVLPYFSADSMILEISQPAFHGNVAFLPIDAQGVALFCPDVFSSQSLSLLRREFGEKALVPITIEELKNYSTNGLIVGGSILIPSLTPLRIQKLFSEWGLDIVELSMPELCEKGGGASRCLVSHCRIDENRFKISNEFDFNKLRKSILEQCEDR